MQGIFALTDTNQQKGNENVKSNKSEQCDQEALKVVLMFNESISSLDFK